MSWVRRILPLPVALLLLVLLAVQVTMLVVSRTQDGRVSGLEVGVTGPALVAQAVTDGVSGTNGISSAVVADPARGRALLADGTLDALVVIDLAEPADRLLVPAQTDPEVTTALVRHTRGVAASYARELRVETVEAGRNGSAWYGLPSVLALGWVLIGLALAAAASAVGGPVPPTSRAGVRRVLRIALAATGTGAATALALTPVLDGTTLPVLVVGTLTVLASAAITLALEALLGLAGLGLSATLVVGATTPLLTLTSPHQLADPARRLLDLTPAWSARAVVEHATYVGGWGPARSLAVLAGWVLLMLLALAVARRERPADASTDASTGAGSVAA